MQLPSLPMLPESIEELVLQYSDHWFYWRNIFTQYVLPEIDAGWRVVGTTCDLHGDSYMCSEYGFDGECEMRPCTECYAVGVDNCDSCDRNNTSIISYDDFQYYMLDLTLSDSYPFLPTHCYRAINRYPDSINFITPISSRIFHPEMPAQVFSYLQKKNLLYAFSEFRKELSDIRV